MEEDVPIRSEWKTMPIQKVYVDFGRSEVSGYGRRVETGAVQFNDDWPGLFIRGDDSFSLISAFRVILDELPDYSPPEGPISDENWQQFERYHARRQLEYLLETIEKRVQLSYPTESSEE